MNGYKKILIITSEFPPGPGGIGNHAFNLAKYLNINGADVKVLAVSDFANETDEDNFDKLQKFEIFRFKRFKSRVKTFRERIKKISKTLDQEKFSHIIFSGRFSLISSLWLRIGRSKTKLIAIAHGGDINAENDLMRMIVNRALRKMDLIIPVSYFSKSKITAGINPKKIVVIPNGFDFADLTTISCDTKASGNGKLNLITVGTVWPRKGHHNVLRALPLMLDFHSQLKYGIIGRLADTSKVKNYFEDERIKKHLNIHGQVSNEELIKILNESQIFIMLSEAQSSGDFEGFGIAVIEANHFGLPAIGSKNSGLEESIQDGVTGILVNPENDKEISDAVGMILADYDRFSRNAKDWAKKHHWSEIIKKYLDAIESIQ